MTTYAAKHAHEDRCFNKVPRYTGRNAQNHQGTVVEWEGIVDGDIIEIDGFLVVHARICLEQRATSLVYSSELGQHIPHPFCWLSRGPLIAFTLAMISLHPSPWRELLIHPTLAMTSSSLSNPPEPAHTHG